MRITDTTLTLFFTRNMSLKEWSDIGIIERELLIYKKLSMHLKKVNIVTYGGRKDKFYSRKLGAINVLPVTWHTRTTTILHLLMKYYPEIKNSSILKTNQISGSEIPLWFKKKFGKKLIVRCGYLYAQFTFKLTKDEATRKKAYRLERDAFSFADVGIVSSLRDREYVLAEYRIKPEKIKVIPNYVATDIFRPIPSIQKNYDLVYVGRGGAQKNLENLLKAIKYLKTEKHIPSLLMIGNCCYDSKIKRMIDKYELDVALNGIIPNFKLPQIINQARIFVLPSYFEGHPKALLEAMSCGIPCLGTNVTGIKNDIEHLVTGYLSETDFKSIADSIGTLLSDESLQFKLGRRARNYILKNYSLDKILQMELEVIGEVLAS